MKVRKGQASPKLDREEFGRRFGRSFTDSRYDSERDALARLEQIAWENYTDGRKAPMTRKAGPEFADPDYELSVEWLETRKRLLEAAVRQKDSATRSRVLVICALARNDGTCPGEMSKTYRLTQVAMDKDAEKAKALELDGWPYPKHLDGRAYGLVVHGDVAGIEGVRRSLSDWLDWMGLIDAGVHSRLDRMIGYYEPYATSHDELDRSEPLIEEVRNVARALANAVGELREGRLSQPDAKLVHPRPK